MIPAAATNEGKTKTTASIIDRNKQLASCGQGVLSLTKEQTKRVRIVLADGDSEKGYKLEQTELQKLHEIDSELQRIAEESSHNYNEELIKKPSYRERLNRLQIINKLLAKNHVDKRHVQERNEQTSKDAAVEALSSSKEPQNSTFDDVHGAV